MSPDGELSSVYRGMTRYWFLKELRLLKLDMEERAGQPGRLDREAVVTSSLSRCSVCRPARDATLGQLIPNSKIRLSCRVNHGLPVEQWRWLCCPRIPSHRELSCQSKDGLATNASHCFAPVMRSITKELRDQDWTAARRWTIVCWASLACRLLFWRDDCLTVMCC